jgi:hypothetical protein
VIIVGIAQGMNGEYRGVHAMLSDGSPLAQSDTGDPVRDWAVVANAATSDLLGQSGMALAPSCDTFLAGCKGMYQIYHGRLVSMALRVCAA